MASLAHRLTHAWDAFTNLDRNTRKEPFAGDWGTSYSSRPDRVRMSFANERTLLASIYTRLGIDVSAVYYRHVRKDDDDRYQEEMPTHLNNCFRVEANLDQGARAFRQDIAMTLFDKGVLAIVPVRTTENVLLTNSYDIKQLRVGHIISWHPQHVKVSVYNEETGKREELFLPKKVVAIVENPFYSVMNEPNSTLQRLIRKLNLLDTVDEASSSGKLDLIIQLPYVVKSEARRQQAMQRRKEVEFQLKGSQYGIAYTDGTEKITQLNRPVENKLLEQIRDLRSQLYVELGLTPEVMDGTADEAAMLNYNNRTVEPILDAITEAMARAFLTKTARSQHQDIMYFRNPFKNVPIKEIADIADKLCRNEVVSSNEIRSGIGMKPSKDPKADELRNSNMPEPSPPEPVEQDIEKEGDRQNGRQVEG